MKPTLLDAAATAMNADPNDETVRLAFFEQLAASELFLLLEAEPVGETVEPRLFETSEGRFILAFDTEERLAAFAEGPAPYAALSGRSVADMLNGQGIGLGLNLGSAPSAQLIPSDAVSWLAQTLSARPNEEDAIPESLSPPGQIPERLLKALDARLAQSAGLARFAYLALATYSEGRTGHLLAVIDPAPGAEAALARAVQDSLTFSGLDAGEIDVTFLKSSDPTAAQLAKVGLRFDLPEPEASEPPSAPGMDPKKPPRLV